MANKFKLWNLTENIEIICDSSEAAKKICSLDNHLYVLTVGKNLYHGTFDKNKQQIRLMLHETVKAIDIDCCSKYVYLVEDTGCVLKHSENLELLSEIKLLDESKTCIHGHSMKCKMKVEKISVGEYGILYITDQGQLWASGSMQQMGVASESPKRVTFFDERFTYCANVGSDFAIAVVSKHSDGEDTDSENDYGEDVFVSNCLKCLSTSQLTSPISQNSLSEFPSGQHLQQGSYDIETTSTSSKNDSISSNEVKGNSDASLNGTSEKTEKNIIFRNTEAAKEFLTRQFSWMSAGEEYIVEYAEKPTRIIKENVTNMASLVYEGVKTVGDKVVTLSRHVSGSSENNDVLEVMEGIHLPRITSKDEFTWSLSQCTSEKDFSEHGMLGRCNAIVKKGSNLLNSEVWTWGNIMHGQLGIGDNVKRERPMKITKLSNVGTHKVSVQSLHAAVLTLDGRAFLWGQNNHHQVTLECDADQSSPKPFPTDGSERIIDAACCTQSSALLTSSLRLYYIGKNAKDLLALQDMEINSEKQEIPDAKFLLSSKHFTLMNTCAYDKSVVDFLVSEQKHLEEMSMVHGTIMKPLQKKNAASAESALFETFCRNYLDLLHFNAANVRSLLDFRDQLISACEVVMFRHMDEFLHVNRSYLNTLHDVVSLGGCNIIAQLIDLPQSAYKLCGNSVTKKDKNSEESVVSTILARPLLRIKLYEEFSSRMYDATGKWSLFINEQQRKQTEAERTKLFWVNSGKAVEFLRSPTRRLIRESHKDPIFLQNAGRFSSHWFILLTDIFVHVNGASSTVHDLTTMWVEPQQDDSVSQYHLQLKMPEDSLLLYANNPEQKMEWLHDLQMAIKSALGKPHGPHPPIVRSAFYTFSKNGPLKDAKYTGRWSKAKMHGSGKMEWIDGKMYAGHFANNQFHGFGRMEIPSFGIYEGQWKDNLQNGFGILKYVNGDVYKGFFKDGLPHGHGSLKQGHFMASAASIYVGDWSLGNKCGYGVMDDIVTGEKYLGTWSENKKHGNGILVTSDGIYYEGVFSQDTLTGHGLMILEDGTHYEGDFKGTGFLNGKGTLALKSGHIIDGSMLGTLADGIKISNAVLSFPKSPSADSSSPSKYFGAACTFVGHKWKALFRNCYQVLGVPENNAKTASKPPDSHKIWQNIAVIISNSQQSSQKSASKIDRGLENSLQNLDTIPQFGRETIDAAEYNEVKMYLQKAFECLYHPLGSLLSDLTNAYTTTYGGLRAHPLLLTHAVNELHSITKKLYEIVRMLFPALPSLDLDAKLSEEDISEVISCENLLYPIILPKVHSPLFILYTLKNKQQEVKYWKRLLEWNKQSDYTLMSHLLVDPKFLKSDIPSSPSTLKDQTFTEAVESLQQLKTTFSPLEKLLVIRQTFQKISFVVQEQLGSDYRWNMDDLFPVFLYIVVRSRITQLGSELNFITDFMEPNLESGELGIMFTTLKACYHYILQQTVSLT